MMATLSTPLVHAGRGPGCRRLLLKHDDLTGLGLGDNKIRKAKVPARIDVGVEYLMLHTLNADPAQLELIAEHVIEPFGDAR